MNIVKFESNKVDNIFEVSNNKGEKILNALARVYSFEDDFVVPLQIYYGNLNDLRLFSAYQNEILKTKGYDLQNFSILKTDYARRVQNCLSSFLSVLDITKHSIGKWTDADLGLVDWFEKKKSELYDGHFCYRFLYKLRNFGVHYSLPFHEIDFDFKTAGTRLSNYKILMHRDRLLEYDGWSSVLKQEIPKMDEKIEVNPFFEEISPVLEKLIREVLNTVIQKGKFNPALLLETYQKARSTSKSQRVAILFKKNRRENAIQMFPVSFLEFYEKGI